MTEYVGWLGLDRRSLDEKDVLSGGVERLNLASPGFLSKAEGASTQVTPMFAFRHSRISSTYRARRDPGRPPDTVRVAPLARPRPGRG